MMNAAISLEHVSKTYGSRVAVSNLSLTVRRGHIFGFLGPNGAGKTTTIHMLLGLLPPSGGRVLVLGQDMTRDPVAVRARVGVMGEQQYIYDDMTAREYLLFFAGLYAVPRPEQRLGELMERVGLAAHLDQRARDFSHGMKQKLGLVRALLHRPELLILDEPVSGLDPTGIAQVRALLLEEKRLGVTVFLSSHILSEVERTADRVAIINRGRLVAEDTVDGLRQRLGGETELVVELAGLPGAVVGALERMPQIQGVVVEGNRLHITMAAGGDHREAISQVIGREGGVIVSMGVRSASLEDAFLTLTEQNVAALSGSDGGMV